MQPKRSLEFSQAYGENIATFTCAEQTTVYQIQDFAAQLKGWAENVITSIEKSKADEEKAPQEKPEEPKKD